MNEKIRVCLIGAGFVGKKHAAAYMRLSGAKLQIVCDTNEVLAKMFAETYGFERVETDWHKAVSAEDVDLVCICVPNNYHYEIAAEAIQYGKHISCEKPLGMSGYESKKLAQLVREKGVVAACCYNMIRIPAIKYAKKLIQSGELGKPVCFRGIYDNERLADPNVAFEWRLLKKNAKGGSLCDLAINILSVAQFLVGDIKSVCGMTEVVHKKRVDTSGKIMEVENEDIAQFLCLYKNGAMGYISSNRVAPGSKQDMCLEVQFTKGVIKFSMEHMNEIQIYRMGTDGFTTILSDENGWFCTGYEELKILDAKALLENTKNNTCPDADFNFAAKIDCVIESVLESAEKKQWVEIRDSQEDR